MKKNDAYSARINKLNKQLLGEASRFIGEEDTAYQEFFRSALEKFGVKSPEDLDDDKKKEFFDYVDKNWDAEGEVNEEDPVELPAADDEEEEVELSTEEDEPAEDEEEELRELIRTEVRRALRVRNAKGKE